MHGNQPEGRASRLGFVAAIGASKGSRPRGTHDSVDWTSYGAFSPTNSARQVATQSLTLRVGGLVSLVSRTWRPSRVCGSGSSMFIVLHIPRGRTQHPAPRKPKPSRALSHDDLHICPLMCTPPVYVPKNTSLNEIVTRADGPNLTGLTTQGPKAMPRDLGNLELWGPG